MTVLHHGKTVNDAEICSVVCPRNNVIKIIIIMPCGCKNKQNQAVSTPKPKTESVIRKASPLGNGSRAVRTEKRIIR